jgi:predicted TIM-barrel fold metal-dependent hydrolase
VDASPGIAGAFGPRGRVDVHVHVSPYWPDPARNVHRPGLALDVETLLAEFAPHGIDHGVLLQTRETPSVEETLRQSDEKFRASGGRLLRTSTVDPTRGEEEVRRAVELWEKHAGLAAIKLYPGYRHFYVHDPRLSPVYEFAAKRRIPVFFHQGDTLDVDGLVKFSRPIEADEVAVRYRDVRFVLCHFGNPWIEECAEIVFKNENVYADTSGLLWPPGVVYYERMLQRAQRRIENAIVTIGHPDRILYGSDWPLQSIATSVRVVTGLHLPDEHKERILGGNARALLGLP